MTFRKGERVEITAKGGTYAGTVDTVRAGKVVAVLDDGRRTTPLDERHFRRTSAPPPPGSINASTWAKGDRVEFDTPDGTAHATILKVNGSNVRAMADGGESEYTVGKTLLRPSAKVLPTPEPSPMDRWSVVKDKSVKAMSEETEAFTAILALDGKAVIQVSNRGTGGCNSYHGDAAARRTFDQDAAKWAKEFGHPDMFEAGDAWLHFVRNVRPYATTDREHVGKLADLSRSYSSPSP